MQEDSFSSSLEDILSEETDGSSPSSNNSSPLLLVTELRKSLTGLDRCVKTYSFLPSEDQVPIIMVDNDDGSSVFTVEPQEVSGDEGLGADDDEDDEFAEYDAAAANTFPRGGMDSFASDVFTTFESNLVRSQSLPEIFSNLVLDLDQASDDDESSSSSLLDSSSKDSILAPSSVTTPGQEQSTSALAPPSHQKENSLSSEAYESAESRPETPISPQKRVRNQLSEKWSNSSLSSVTRSSVSRYTTVNNFHMLRFC